MGCGRYLYFTKKIFNMPVLIKDLNKDLAVTDTLLCASAYTPATAYTTEDKCLNPTAANPLQGGTIRLKNSLNNQYQIITAKDLYNFYPDVVYKNVFINPYIKISSGSSSYPSNRVSGSIEDWFWFSTSNNSGVYPFRLHLDFYSLEVSQNYYYPASNSSVNGFIAWYNSVSYPGSTPGTQITSTTITHGNTGAGLEIDFSTVEGIYGCSGEVNGFGRMSTSSSSTKTNASAVKRHAMSSRLCYYGDNHTSFTAASTSWLLTTTGSSITPTNVFQRNMRCRHLKKPDDRYNIATDIMIAEGYEFVATYTATHHRNIKCTYSWHFPEQQTHSVQQYWCTVSSGNTYNEAVNGGNYIAEIQVITTPTSAQHVNDYEFSNLSFTGPWPTTGYYCLRATRTSGGISCTVNLNAAKIVDGGRTEIGNEMVDIGAAQQSAQLVIYGSEMEQYDDSLVLEFDLDFNSNI